MALFDHSFFVGVYWSARQEALGDCGKRGAAFLQKTASTHPALNNWYRIRMPQEKQKIEPFDISAKTITAILQNHFDYEMRHPGWDESFGVTIEFSNDDRKGVSVRGLISCGGYHEYLYNQAVLYFAPRGNAPDRFVKFELMKQLLEVSVQCWDPDKGMVGSIDFCKAVDADGKRRFIGWLTYLSRKRGELPELPPPVKIEEIFEHGNTIVLSPSPPSASDENAIALARTVYEPCKIDETKLAQEETLFPPLWEASLPSR